MLRSPVVSSAGSSALSSVGSSFDLAFGTSRDACDARSALYAGAFPTALADEPAPRLGARVARQMVALCMFCGSARVPARTADSADRWAPLPPSLRERIEAGTSGLVVSHALCPTCARARYPELF